MVFQQFRNLCAFSVMFQRGDHIARHVACSVIGCNKLGESSDELPAPALIGLGVVPDVVTCCM